MKIKAFNQILNKIGKKNIVIFGHMGSGKSIIGKKIANYFEVPHVDTDMEITKEENKSINRIFLENGESYFRKIESKIVIKNLKKENIVISLGGGAILSQDVRKKIKKRSYSIFLRVDFNILHKRLKKSKNRPLLRDVNILTTIKELDSKRKKYYLDADKIINNSKSSNRTFINFKKNFLSLND